MLDRQLKVGQLTIACNYQSPLSCPSGVYLITITSIIAQLIRVYNYNR